MRQMNKKGIHHLVWHADVGPKTTELLPLIRAAGYDGIEIPIFAPQELDTQSLRAAVEDAGLACTTSSALPEGLSLINEDVSQDSICWFHTVIKATAELGAPILCGPLAVPVGELPGRGYTSNEWDTAVQSFKEISLMAADYGVVLALEPLNRFETFFINTIAAGIRLAEAVDNPSFGLLLDTFHMHIEEKSTLAAIRLAVPHLKHFHCSENDRGTVGSGQVLWKEIFAALKEIHYGGWLVVESFGAAMPELARATCMWRPPAASPTILANDSLRFIQQQLAVMA